MKKTAIVLTGTLLSAMLGWPLGAAGGLAPFRTRVVIKKDISNLIQDENGIQKESAEIAKYRVKLENDVLAHGQRSSLQGFIRSDKGVIANYRDEAMDDVEYLSFHRASLNRQEKDLVAEARIDLENGLSDF